MNLLILNTAILAVDTVDMGDAWATVDQVIPKHVVPSAQLVTVDALPADYAPGRYAYDGGFVLNEDITDARAALLTRINERRDELETAGFTYLDKPLDSDSRSVQRITTAVQAAQVAVAVGQPFALDWTCADNSTLALDAQTMLGMPVALAQHANALHQHSRSLKTLAEAAETSADLASINIMDGWPA